MSQHVEFILNNPNQADNYREEHGLTVMAGYEVVRMWKHDIFGSIENLIHDVHTCPEEAKSMLVLEDLYVIAHRYGIHEDTFITKFVLHTEQYLAPVSLEFIHQLVAEYDRGLSRNARLSTYLYYYTHPYPAFEFAPDRLAELRKYYAVSGPSNARDVYMAYMAGQRIFF